MFLHDGLISRYRFSVDIFESELVCVRLLKWESCQSNWKHPRCYFKVNKPTDEWINVMK